MSVNGVEPKINAYEANRTSRTPKNGKKQETRLSREAQAYLKELKTKYKNMDFTVASYDTPEEAQQYMNNGTKEYSVVIDPETLEKMAADKDTRSKYEAVLENAGARFTEMKEGLGEDADKVQSVGIEIDKNGQVTYVANLLESVKTDQAEKSKEKEDEKKPEKTEGKTKRVTGQSIPELLKKLREELAGKSPDRIISDKEKAIGQSFDVKW